MIQLYVGDGKGKTSAAIGLAVRAAGAGLKVGIIFFDKGETGCEKEDEGYYSERTILREIPNVEVFSTGLPRFRPGLPFRTGMTEEDMKEVRRGYNLAEELLRDKRYGVVILDEILGALQTGAIVEEEVIALMALCRRPPERELVLTGRVDSPTLIQHADLVTEMRKVKHYFDTGSPPRKGIEY